MKICSALLMWELSESVKLGSSWPPLLEKISCTICSTSNCLRGGEAFAAIKSMIIRCCATGMCKASSMTARPGKKQGRPIRRASHSTLLRKIDFVRKSFVFSSSSLETLSLLARAILAYYCRICAMSVFLRRSETQEADRWHFLLSRVPAADREGSRLKVFHVGPAFVVLFCRHHLDARPDHHGCESRQKQTTPFQGIRVGDTNCTNWCSVGPFFLMQARKFTRRTACTKCYEECQHNRISVWAIVLQMLGMSI